MVIVVVNAPYQLGGVRLRLTRRAVSAAKNRNHGESCQPPEHRRATFMSRPVDLFLPKIGRTRASNVHVDGRGTLTMPYYNADYKCDIKLFHVEQFRVEQSY
jgi:hypothetical protein